MHLSRSTAEIQTMRAVKAALDPAGLLNPGVLFPDE
ncbi:MAG: FAD-linked oxidase C-terminal domain-containing protein [Mycobacteriales bacterium]